MGSVNQLLMVSEVVHTVIICESASPLAGMLRFVAESCFTCTDFVDRTGEPNRSSELQSNVLRQPSLHPATAKGSTLI